MDPHVSKMAEVLKQLHAELGGEMYETPTYDKNNNPIELCPALKTQIDRWTMNVLLFDVPGPHDHFSIVLNARPAFTLSLREETRWDFVLKALNRVEDHIVGAPAFDKQYLIGGQPAELVIAFLQDPKTRLTIRAMEPFHHLACDTGFVRASFPLTPWKSYDLSELRERVQIMRKLTEGAEAVHASAEAPHD